MRTRHNVFMVSKAMLPLSRRVQILGYALGSDCSEKNCPAR